MAKYNGHRNWNHWNVALWMFNDESLYRLMRHAVASRSTLDNAADYLAAMLAGQSTPDGAPYSRTAIRAAIRHWEG